MHRSPRLVCVAAVGGIATFSTICAAVEPIESFFLNSLAGWTTDNGGPLQFVANGGNPGGHLVLDNDEIGIAHIIAPDYFHGNLSSFDGGQFAFDGMLVAGGGGFWMFADDYGVVAITGGGMTASVDLVPGGGTAPLGAWATYSTPFTADAFGVSDAQWATMLADVTSVTITIEALFGPEIEAIDNVRLIGLCGPSDVNGDGMVDFQDLLAVISVWGPTTGDPADVNGNGTVDFVDLLLVIGNWGDCL